MRTRLKHLLGDCDGLSKKDLKVGEWGEGYVADNESRYNCGNASHWGDVGIDFYEFDVFC